MANLPASRHDSIKLGEVSASMKGMTDPMAAAAQRSERAHAVWLRQARRPASSLRPLRTLHFAAQQKITSVEKIRLTLQPVLNMT